MVNKFFRSIGFKNLKKNEELWELLEHIIKTPDEQKFSQDSGNNEFAMFRKYITEDIGVCVCGYFTGETDFRMEYYYPFFEGKAISTMEPVDIERHASREAYVGICDDFKLGVTLMFYIDNIAEVLQKKKYLGSGTKAQGAVLSALASEGKILLPVSRPTARVTNGSDEQNARMQMMRRARAGDQEAIDSLTLGEANIYSELSRRVEKEDILSIVESSLIPYGIDSDEYVVLGEILSCKKETNPISREQVWLLQIRTNGIEFDVCINTADLMGEPQPGRRFRGNIWLQGKVMFI